MKAIQLDTQYLKGFVSSDELEKVVEAVHLVDQSLENGDCPGRDYIGWLRLPTDSAPELLRDIKQTARRIRNEYDALLVLGIGGSYLGSRAAIEFLRPIGYNERGGEALKLYFAGHNLSADYVRDILQLISKQNVAVNVISKSGTTTETAVVFRIVQQALAKRYGKKGLSDRIIATTDAQRGALRCLADENGYKTFVIPDDVGGRFSVLTPVGLLPIAAAGIRIDELLAGAAACRAEGLAANVKDNQIYRYAAIRHILYRSGKTIELLSGFHPGLWYVGEWWKQLFGESEGKDGKGIFPATCAFTTDLHSMGQMIQDGMRVMFETFLTIEGRAASLKIPRLAGDPDGLNYLAGKELEYINKKALAGTAAAHWEGGVPNITLTLAERDPYCLGYLFYFFEKAVALSGLLLGVNPFNQPGVEAYKKKMFQLLGKPAA